MYICHSFVVLGAKLNIRKIFCKRERDEKSWWRRWKEKSRAPKEKNKKEAMSYEVYIVVCIMIHDDGYRYKEKSSSSE